MLKLQFDYAQGNIEKVCYWLKKIEKLDLYIEPTTSNVRYTVIYYKLLLVQNFPDMKFLLDTKMENLECPVDSKRTSDLATFVQVKLLCVRNDFGQALSILNQLIPASAKRQRILYLITKSSILHLQKEHSQAIATLEEAIDIAEPQNVFCYFTDEGNKFLIEKINGHSQFVQKLAPNTSTIIPTNKELLQPLGDREREILSLLCKSYTYKRIADELYLSINTIKWYLKKIYEKMMVTNREQAIKKAYELELY